MTSRARDRSSTLPPRGESSPSSRRTRDRTRRTAHAGRYAAAYDRSAAASRSRRGRRRQVRRDSDRQAEPGALADRLGRKERLKQLRLVFRRDPGPIVLNFEANFLSRIEEANHDVSSLPSGGFERLLRVDHEIERHLLELGEVRIDG